MPEFRPFLMERVMSRFEQDVECNLSESGLHPVSLGELLGDDARYMDHLLRTRLGYPHVTGLAELRERITDLCDGATLENVLVTVGAAEANYTAIRTLLSAADGIVIMLPNYLQIWCIAENHDLQVREFRLRKEMGWAPHLDEPDEAVTPKSRLIAVCNPDNPTGYILTESEMNAIIAAAERAEAWILADEVYRGAEPVRDGQTVSF